MDWLKRILGKPTSSPPPEPAARPADDADNPLLDQMLNEGFDARTAFYGSLGELDPDLISNFINPTFMGGPRWPALRQSWRVIRRPASTIIASDGLSDVFDDDLTPLGYEVEVCVETDGEFASPQEPWKSWEFDLVYQVSQLVASSGRVAESVERYGTVSSAFEIPNAPEQMKDAQGRVGIIIGFPAPDLPTHIELPQGRVRLLVVKPLIPSELAYLEAHGDPGEARDTLVARLAEQPRAHFATADRDAVA